MPGNSTFNSASLVSSLGYDFTKSWDLTNITWTNGATSAFGYRPDQVGLASLTHAIPSQLNQTWNFSYTAAGQIGTDGEDWYSYDMLGRLSNAYVADPTNSNTAQRPWQQFTYDAFGNRASLSTKLITNWSTPSAGSQPLTSYSTTSLASDPRNLATYSMTSGEVSTMAATNQIPATIGGVATGAGATGYDPYGNLKNVYAKLGDSTTQLAMTYDALARVTTLADTKRAVTESYLYDDQGLRTRTWDGTTYRYNIYDEGRKLIAQYTKTPAGSLTWKDDIIYVGTKEVAQVGSDGKTRVTFEDHLGSPRYEWDGSTAYIQQKFLPFGEQLSASAITSQFAKGLTNHEQTDPSGLIYMQARFYMPWYGRFGSPDPARDQHFEQTQSWNIYGYVRNNPTNNVDMTGAFSTPTHELINRQIFSGSDLKIINKSSLHVDGGRTTMLYGAQSQKNAYQHGMRSPEQTVEQARKQAMDYKEKAMASAVQKEANGDHKGAMKELGKVMHLVQDMASPQHEGFQAWNGLSHPRDAMAHHKAEQESEKGGLQSESVQKALENSKVAKEEFENRVAQEQERRAAERAENAKNKP